jgi:hypothetical protein
MPAPYQTSVGLKVHLNAVVDVSVGWSLTAGFGVVIATSKLKEKLMNHLTAAVFVGAALLPAPGWRKLH